MTSGGVSMFPKYKTRGDCFEKLAELLKTTPVLRTEGTTDIEILDVTADSRQVKEGSLFSVLRGRMWMDIGS